MLYGNEESQLLLSDDRFDTATSEIEELLSKVKSQNTIIYLFYSVV